MDITTLEKIRAKFDTVEHTPVDATEYIEAVKNAKHPFDDGFNHGRECAYKHLLHYLDTEIANAKV